MKTAFVVLACALLVLAACGQKAPAVDKTAQEAQPATTAEVSDTEVSALSTNIDGAGTQSVDTSGLDSLDSDLDAIDSLNI